MKAKIIGITIIAIGLIMLIYTGFGYVTTAKVVDLGQIEINKEKNHVVQWQPIVGVILLIGGTLVIVFDEKIRT